MAFRAFVDSSANARVHSDGTPVRPAERDGPAVQGLHRMDKRPAKERSDSDGSRGRLSSVATAVHLLKAFSEEESELGISTLARRLGVAKSTAHRLAVTLVAEGMLEQNADNGRYRLGLALFGLGALVRRRMDVSNEAKNFITDLRERTNETVHLAVLDGSEIMYVRNLESRQAIRMRSDLGERKPAYCTAEGQAILAYQPPETIGAVIKRGLRPRTPHTITDPAKLIKTLDLVRQRGCAIEDEQSEVGMRCIAAPVWNDGGEVIAAVGVAGPVSRLTKKAAQSFLPHVIETAALISARLGHRTRAMG
jgi:IclR family KDG regulon transcriptional repressor